ncbi:MAG: bis(5'-nucleosyl)-tetraphosphatase (symmetrical) YqeK [Lachnospiraceae bacterium]|nr:bis(5'-nucleosyl)-tetraphosphatase (symmetrical) YqeK [Lachnospiraceae bacterium]
MDLKEVHKDLKLNLKKKRYVHTLGVEFTAAALAMRYGEDIFKAQLAGALHDQAKYVEDEKMLSICKKNKLSVSNVEKRNPYLLHGKVGALWAKEKYGIEDEDILNAITYHTTGRPGMGLLEKIVFIADYIEPSRDKAPNLEEIRRLSFENIDRAVIRVLEDTIKHLKEGSGEMDDMTLKTYEYYVGKSL